MKRAHGPYKHGARWRMVVTEDDGRQTATSFATRVEAVSAITSEQLAIAASTQGVLVAAMAVALPDDPAWVYFLHAEDGAVVYVGMSGNVADRVGFHRIDKTFAWVTILPTVMPRSSATRVEAMLVHALQPQYNVTLQPVGNKSLGAITSLDPTSENPSAIGGTRTPTELPTGT